MTDQNHRLSRSAEDYLEAIGHLCNLHGQAQVSDIAERLGVKKPSVTAAMRQLSAEGLIEYRQYAPIRLTPKGLKLIEVYPGVDMQKDILDRLPFEVEV